MKKVTSTSIKNGHLHTLYKILDKPHHGKEARSKSRFLDIIIPRINEIDKERIRILEGLADKDKDGKPISENEQFKLSDNSMEQFRKEYGEYLSEDFIIDILPSNEGDISTITEMLLNDTTPLTTEEGAIYDNILTELEKIKG